MADVRLAIRTEVDSGHPAGGREDQEDSEMRQRSMAGKWSAMAAAWLVVVAPVSAGKYIEQTVSSSQGGMNMEVRAWTDGENGKVEFTRSDSDLIPAGSYLLTSDGGQTVHLIDPAAQTFSVWDMEALFASLGQALKGAEGVIDLDFNDVHSEDLGSEPGGEMLGFDTTKESWSTGYTMDMKVVFMKQSQRLEATTEAWITDEIDNPTLGIWFAVKPPTTGDPDLDQILTQNMERIDGTPLKIVQQSTMTDVKKKKKKAAGRGAGGRTTTTTMEVTAFREESVDMAVFAMPEGYTETPLIPQLSGAAGQNDEQGGALEGLSGMFGRKKKNDG